MQQAPETGTKESVPDKAKDSAMALDDMLAATPFGDDKPPQAPEAGTKESGPDKAKDSATALADVFAAEAVGGDKPPPQEETKESVPAKAKESARELDDILAGIPFGGDTLPPKEETKVSAPAKEEVKEEVVAAVPMQAKTQATEEEPDNEFAVLAIAKGLLRKRSPLLYSQMAGNKGFDLKP